MTSRQATSAYAKVGGKAVAKVQAALKSGALVRPNECQNCGLVGRPEGHHHNGYAPEHWLDVEWLCRPCHLGRHGRRAHLPTWEREGARAYMDRTRGPGPERWRRPLRSATFTSLTTPSRFLMTTRRMWDLLVTDEERAEVAALVAELHSQSRQEVA